MSFFKPHISTLTDSLSLTWKSVVFKTGTEFCGHSIWHMRVFALGGKCSFHESTNRHNYQAPQSLNHPPSPTVKQGPPKQILLLLQWASSLSTFTKLTSTNGSHWHVSAAAPLADSWKTYQGTELSDLKRMCMQVNMFRMLHGHIDVFVFCIYFHQIKIGLCLL